MKIPIEDNFTDVLGKAKRGLRLPDADLARRAGVAEAEVQAVLSGKVDEAVIRKLAGPLHLGADALAALAKQAWYPSDPVICPGHGPLTTVGEEKQHNPFFT